MVLQGRAELMLARAREAKEEVNSFLCVYITLIQEKKKKNSTIKSSKKMSFFLFYVWYAHWYMQTVLYLLPSGSKESVCLRAFVKQHFPAAHVLFKNATSPLPFMLPAGGTTHGGH